MPLGTKPSVGVGEIQRKKETPSWSTVNAYEISGISKAFRNDLFFFLSLLNGNYKLQLHKEHSVIVC